MDPLEEDLGNEPLEVAPCAPCEAVFRPEENMDVAWMGSRREALRAEPGGFVEDHCEG